VTRALALSSLTSGTWTRLPGPAAVPVTGPAGRTTDPAHAAQANPASPASNAAPAPGALRHWARIARKKIRPRETVAWLRSRDVMIAKTYFNV
jgi:pyruvate/2-oxoglutarate dehydrogenase complex dihydrolipoamide acyltransferase (E2) component